MIWSSGSFVPAWHLKVGDALTDGPSGKTVAIVSIRSVRSKGAYAPFTPSGTIVVDGVLASSFVSLTADDGLEIAGGIELSTQWMSRMFELPSVGFGWIGTGETNKNERNMNVNVEGSCCVR